jgi:hypothetical protein
MMVSERTVIGLFYLRDMCEEHKIRVCSKCKRELPLDDIHFAYQNRSDGVFKYACKECAGHRFKKPFKRQLINGQLQCIKCLEWFDASIEFYYATKTNPWGYHYQCKKCLGGAYGIKKKHPHIASKPNYKVCNKCRQELPATDKYFNKAKTKSGLYHICKSCCRDNYLLNSVVIYAKNKEYKKKNKIKLNDWMANRSRERRKEDIQFAISCRLRSSIRPALKKHKISLRTQELIGCTFLEFKVHFESLFIDGMSWGEFMAGNIHIDHRIPLVLFDLTDNTQLHQACHYTNLQPLWALDNMRKGSLYNGKRHYRKKD